MRRVFFLFLLLFLLSIRLASADTLPPQAGIGQVDPNRGPCVTNYTRKAPGLCWRNTAFSHPSSSTCNSFDSKSADGFPATAISVLLGYQLEVQSANGIALRTNTLSVYASSDTSCLSTVLSFNSLSAYEFVATAATRIGFTTGFIGAIPIVNGILNTQLTTTNLGNIIILGYTD